MGDLNVAVFTFVVSFIILLLNTIEIKRQTKSKRDVFLFVVFVPVTILIILLSAVLYPILMSYRMIISIILRRKYGDKFCGLVRGLDVVSATQTMKQNTITAVVLFETDTETSTESIREFLNKVVTDTIMQNETHLGKLLTTLDTFSGYKFLKKTNIHMHECIRRLPTIDGELNNDSLKKLISHWYFEPFNGPLLWDVAFGTQPLQQKDNGSSKKCYPLVLRVHHVVSDGITILKFFVGLLTDKLNNSNPSTFEKYVKTEEIKFATLLHYVYFILQIIVYFPTALYSMVVLKCHDHNELHGKALSNNEKVAYTLDENGTYFQKVKKIRKYTNASVPEIVLAAFSESMKEHFIKYHKSCPNDITLTLPVVQNYTELKTIQPGLDVSDIHLNNRFIILCLKVPFFVENDEFDENMPVLSKLSAIRRLVDVMKTSVEVPVSKIVFHYFFGALPTSWVRHICGHINSTVCVSLIPGPPKIFFNDGVFSVRDIIFWSPHLLGLDLMFGSLSYDDRLVLSFNCDAVYMADQSIAQEVLENTYKYMDLLEDELQLHQK
ncbi:hypothetical protein PPYR_10764 [Photinus pyralis]|uniref:O-acyltransferase WSD1 C-terminal domain-containing protein n=1 Tax=Photinus pyralis TaxID=7054 RepID=A0A5N4AHC6_PHOPY|nr:uncharacterized protein LOC116174450 [Photinus pyralis]KAB0796703.1 hypothetical protein PPYR_10764 [Photinus pyralis]